MGSDDLGSDDLLTHFGLTFVQVIQIHPSVEYFYKCPLCG